MSTCRERAQLMDTASAPSQHRLLPTNVAVHNITRGYGNQDPTCSYVMGTFKAIAKARPFLATVVISNRSIPYTAIQRAPKPQPAITIDILTHSAISDELWRDLPLSLLAEAQRLGTSALHCTLVHRACVDAVLCAIDCRISNLPNSTRTIHSEPSFRTLARKPSDDQQLSSPTPFFVDTAYISQHRCLAPAPDR